MTVDTSLALPPEMLLLTERYAVYRCYSDQGELLYIGSTGSLGRRFGAHMEKAWFLQVRGITLEWYADELSARNAEHRAIHVEHPKYNVQSRSAPTQRRSVKGRRRPPPRPPANGPVTEAQARSILAVEPDISGAELGRRLGKTPRYGCMLKAKLAASVAGPDTGEQS